MADFPLTKTAQAVDDALNEIDGTLHRFVNDFKTNLGQSISTAATQSAAALPKAGGTMTGDIVTSTGKSVNGILGAALLNTNVPVSTGTDFSIIPNSKATGFGYESGIINSPGASSGYLTVLKNSTQTASTSSIFSDNIGALFFKFGNSSWNELLHTGNTTVDGSGFIKEASPIIQLFTDSIKLNAQCSGDELLTHDNTGVYLISNCTGFSLSGWYIETPKDANNNVKVFVEYEQLENNDILIKTYEPDYSSGKCSAGAPCDITQDRWIDIRLNPIEQINELEE